MENQHPKYRYVLRAEKGDWFKVRYLNYDIEFCLVQGEIYNATYMRWKLSDGRVKVSKAFVVKDASGDIGDCDNDAFEIVTEPESGLGFTLKPGTYIEPQE